MEPMASGHPRPTAPEAKCALLGLTLEELQTVAQELELPRFAASQMARWLYRHGAQAVEAMSDLSLRARAELATRYDVGRTPPVQRLQATDGTSKYLFPVGEGRTVESAVIPDGERRTLCLSCQSGCRMGCQFCATGKGTWGGSLSAGEMINQLLGVDEHDAISNIVFMGMGEPMDNLKAVLTCLTILTAPWGLATSPRRITVSTIGIIPQLRQLLSQSECHVAVSLHSPFQPERQELVPATRQYPLADLLHTLCAHRWDGQRRLSFEYVVLAGVNDSTRHVDALARLLHGLPCLVNLIGYHPHPLSSFRRPPEVTLQRMRQGLIQRGIHTTIRTSKGLEIAAACGLLSRTAGHTA